MSLFEKGRQKTGGRAKGARNKLSVAFLEAFAADFEEHGADGHQDRARGEAARISQDGGLFDAKRI
jgi:hypothetical protein